MESLMNKTLPDGACLRYNSDGRLQSINRQDGSELKSFLYDSDGLLIQLHLLGYRLTRTGDRWTDGEQTFDIEISLAADGAVTLTDRSCRTTTKLNPDGSFVIRVDTGQEHFLHHNSRYPHQIDRIEYPDGTERYFCCNSLGELTLIDEPDGYWLKMSDVWVHYNSQGKQVGSKAIDIAVDYNGLIAFCFIDGTEMIVTAFGECQYLTPILLAA